MNLHGRKCNIPLKGFVKKESHTPSVLGNKGQGCIQASSWVVKRNGPAVKFHFTARFAKPHDSVRNAQLALSGQSAYAKNLAFLDIKIHIAHSLT